MKNTIIILAIISMTFQFLSCSNDQKALDDEAIQNYIRNNNLNAIAAQDGLYYVIEVEGTGAQASSVGSRVTVHYTGKFLDNTIFDSSINNSPITAELYNFIKGWQYGIPYFKVGGTGKLLIPSHLAYGSSGSGSIPANTPLLFEIQLIGVQN